MNKQILFWLFFLFLSFKAEAQTGFFINDSTGGMRVMNNSFIYVKGDFKILNIDTTPVRRLINGQLFIEKDFVCDKKIVFDKDSNSLLSNCNLIFVGNGDSHISGMQIPQLFGLKINKSSGNIFVDSDIEVHDTIDFISGNGIIGQDVEVKLKFRQGTNTVNAHPYIKNENSFHRFTGDGHLTTELLVTTNHPEDLANTGFYYRGHGSDSLYFRRGHKKQLFAGEGSIDRYYDIDFRIDTTNSAQFDSIAMKYLSDVDYIPLGVDTSKLKMYLAPVFDDAYFVRANSDFKETIERVNLYTEGAFNPNNYPQISPNYFRMTLGDTTCTNAPFSALPDTLIHLCLGDSVELSAQNIQPNGFPNSVYYFWNDSITVQNRTFIATTGYQEFIVKLTDQRGCFSYDTVKIAPIAPDPIAGFEWDNICFGNSTQIIDTSSISSGTISSFWNFGDLNTLLNVSADTLYHNYAAPGAFELTQTVISNYGCQTIVSQTVNVYNYPIADFSIAENCFYNSWELNGSSSIGVTIPTNYAITSSQYVLDGNVIPGFYNNLVILPDTFSVGSHTIDLIVGTSLNCIDTLSQNFVVYPKDTASFVVNDVCLFDTLNVLNTSYIVNGPANFYWSFGDGTFSTDENPIKVYSTSGPKIVQLIIETQSNCNDTISHLVNVHSLPISGINHSTICVDQNVNFWPNNTSVNNAYHWSFGNGLEGFNALSNNTYNLAGSYTVQLHVEDLNLCHSEYSEIVNIQSPPSANFTTLPVCEGEQTMFINNSNGNGLNYNWNFGDFSTASNQPDPIHIYQTDGSYSVSLVVTDVFTCSDTMFHSVLIHPNPTLTLGNISTCGDSYILDALNTGSTFLWSPNNETTQDIIVNSNGYYSVDITNVYGCEGSFGSNVVLNSTVSPYLGVDTSVCGNIVLDASYPGSNYAWNTGAFSQNIIVSTPGLYYVSVTDQNNCVGIDSINILNVYPFNTPDLGGDISLCSSSFPIVLSPGNFASYSWNDGSTGPDLSVSGSNNVIVFVTDLNGCTGSDSLIVQSLDVPISNLQTNNSACDEFTLVASMDNTLDFLWNTGSTDNLLSVTSSGNYSVQITDPNTGCSTLSNSNVQIQTSPVVNLGADTALCANLGLTLDASNVGSNYVWSSSSNALLSTNQTYSPPSSGTYTVEVENNGCFGMDAITINLLPAPYIPEQSLIKYICGSTPVDLLGSPFGNNIWTSTSGFNSLNQAVSVSEPGTYFVNASISGCSANETFVLEISPLQIQSFFMVNTDTSKNLALQFVDLSTPQPISYLWDFGDGTYDTISNPIHTYAIEDTFETSLTVSNGVCISTYNKSVNAKILISGVDPNSMYLEQISYSLYPNPFSSSLNYEFELNDEATIEIVIFDVTGKIVSNVGMLANSSSGSFTIPTDHLETGVYYLGMTASSLKGNIIKRYKIIKL